VILERLGPDIDYSLYRWLRTVPYTVEAVTGTLLTHHAPLDIIPAYPSDLTKLRRSTLALSVPQETVRIGDQYLGELGEDTLTGSIYGFLVSTEDERMARFAQSRLVNDVYQLLDKAGEEEGVSLYRASTHALYGSFEITSVRSRMLPVNAPHVPADRYKFVVDYEVLA
jgi:hypothetical protein